MTIIEALQSYFASCTHISSLNQRVRVDFLGDKGNSISIEPIPTNPLVSKYVGGGGEYQYSFYIAIKFNYSDELKMTLDNSGFFEDLVDWIEEQNVIGNLPELEDGKTSEMLEVVSSGCLFGVTEDFKYGRYQIQCRLVYEVE